MPPPPVPPPAPPPPDERDVPEEIGIPGEAHGRRRDGHYSWGLCFLTPKVGADGSIEAWQMTCKRKGHMPCNRTRSVAAAGSPDLCFRELKMWASIGARPHVRTKAQHKAAWAEEVEVAARRGDLPRIEWLDENPVWEYPADAVG